MMKKRTVVVVSICVSLCIILIGSSFLLTSVISKFIPQKYDVYVDGELYSACNAYEYMGHIYLPVLGTMEIHGYQTTRSMEEHPIFVIDGEQYQLIIENNEIKGSKGTYLGVSTGQCFLNISKDDVYVLASELDIFFEKIGQDPVKIEKTDWMNKCIYFFTN